MSVIVQEEWEYWDNGETNLSISFSKPTQAGNSIVFVAIVPNGASATSSFVAPTDTQGLTFNKVTADICEQGPLWQWSAPDIDTDSYYTVLSCCLATGTQAAGDTISFTIANTIQNGYVSAFVTIYEVQGQILFDTSASNFSANPNATLFNCGTIAPATGYFETAACITAQDNYDSLFFTFPGEYIHQEATPLAETIGAVSGEAVTGCTFEPNGGFDPVTMNTPTMGAIWAFTTQSISGNAAAAGATISYSGTSSGSVTADGFGNYSIPNLTNGTYTVTPSYGSDVFTPASQNVTIDNDSQTGIDFAVLTISGNTSVAGATVSWSGTSSGSTTADAFGDFFINLGNGSYTITPTKAGSIFVPTSQNETLNGSSISGVDFTTSTLTISGNIGGIKGTVTYSGAANGTVSTDSSGNYLISGLNNGTYQLYAHATGYLFTPAPQVEVLAGFSPSGVDFTPTQATPQAIIVGRYEGTSVGAAFPQNKKQLDLVQIEYQGIVVWNLNYAGVVTANPATWTKGTILGQFYGSSWTECFVENNTNPGEQDLIQVMDPGGDVVWLLDYTGTTYQA
jgi:hypothetical protein